MSGSGADPEFFSSQDAVRARIIRFMYRRMPPLHALAAFEAAARHGSFARAAGELYLTHSAVSHRIRMLEQHLETRLFYRLNRQVSLTPQGEAFLVTVRDALARLHAAASGLRDSARRALRVSVMPAFAASWLIHRLGDFYRSYPDIDLELQTTARLVSFRSGEADIGVRYGPGDWPGLESALLFSDHVFPVASPEYLASVPAIAGPADLTQCVLLRHRRLPWRPWFDAAGLHCDEPASGPVFSDVGFMIDACASGQGIALARSTLAAPHIDSGRLRRLTDVAAASEWHFFVVHTPEAGLRPEVAAFRSWLVDRARACPGGSIDTGCLGADRGQGAAAKIITTAVPAST